MINEDVAAFLADRMPEVQILVAENSTASSRQAAAEVGSKVERIGKSIVFASPHSTALVLISAARRVSRSKLRSLARDDALKVASPEVVSARTGYVVGGVAPFVLPEGVQIFVDIELTTFETVWISAGSPNSVVELTKGQLRELFAGRLFDLCEDDTAEA